MSKKHKNNPYRKIYENHYGKIPKGMHIHHIDGNPENNSIDNLACITPEEHSAIHGKEALKWSSIGGILGGNKAKNEKLGWHDPSKRRKRGFRQPEGFSQKQSERLKQEYESKIRIHWTKSEKFTNDEIHNLISKGDPGKSTRGKPSNNRGKKMVLKDRELANKRKQEAALNRKKYECPFCSKSFDGGNFNKHMICKHSFNIEEIANLKQKNN